jgi:hypothetical protein
MALDIGRLISEIYSGLSSPSSQWARRDMSVEKKKALDEEAQRKMELQKQIDSGAAQRVELTNAGHLETQGLANTGALARQTLANTGATEAAGITGKYHLEGQQAMSEAHRFGSEKTAESERYKANLQSQTQKNIMDKDLRARQIEGLTSVISKATVDPDKINRAADALLTFGGANNPETGISASLIDDEEELKKNRLSRNR